MVAADVKAVLEKAHFSVPANTAYEGFLIVKKSFKKIQRRTSESMIFNAKDILVDALIMDFRPTPEVNVWRKRIPLDIISYCYKSVPFRRMAFVYDATDISETQLDYLVCIFDDRFVTKSMDYASHYESAVARLARR